MGLYGGSKSSTSSGGTSRGGREVGINPGKQAIIMAPQSPYRPLFIMVWPNTLFKAHWSFWIPSLGRSRTVRGKRVHVIGSVSEGFRYEFVRNYDLSETTSHPSVFEIGSMRIEDLQDTPLDGHYSRDATPLDRFEATALTVPAPTPSLNQVSAQNPGSSNRYVGSSRDTPGQSRSSAPRRVVVRDCQYWVKQVVEALLANHLLLPPQRGVYAGQDPFEILAMLPKH